MKSPFNHEAIYDAEIAPLMAQIIDICQKNHIPMVASFNFAHGRNPDEPDRDDFCSTYLHDGLDPWWAPEEIVAAMRIVRDGAMTRPKGFAMMVSKTEVPA